MCNCSHYRIIRHYFNTCAQRIMRRGLTLSEAQAYCRDPETSSKTCRSYVNVKRTKRLGPWFDGYSCGR